MSEVTVDPTQIPKKMTIEELEYFVLFAICVAGKGAKQTQEKLNQYLESRNKCSPFNIVKIDMEDYGGFNALEYNLKKVKIGQYKRIEKAFREVVKLDVTKDLTVEKLEAIPGIGPKTARFIVLYTNPDADCAVIDTHVLKFLKKEYPAFDVPKSTPSKGRKYKELEELFQYSAKRAGKSVRELDSEVWQFYANK